MDILTRYSRFLSRRSFNLYLLLSHIDPFLFLILAHIFNNSTDQFHQFHQFCPLLTPSH